MTQISAAVLPFATRRLPLVAAVIYGWALASALADGGSPSVSLRSTGTNFEGDTEYVLEWPAQPNGLYRIQQRDGFESNTTWTTIDVVVPSGTGALFHAVPERKGSNASPARFLRVQAPSPEIFAIEPAVVSTSGGVISVRGQCLGTNATLRVGGVDCPATGIASNYMFHVPAGLGEGIYDLEILDGTNVIAMASKLFSVTGQPTPVGESAQRLFEPPWEPPASPALMKAKEKANRTKCGSNLRVLPPTGEIQLEETDLFTPGRGLDFVWTRTYRSRTGTNTAIGQGWDFSYNARVELSQDLSRARVIDGAGHADVYFRDGSGLYTCNEQFNTGSMTPSNSTFTLTFPDGGAWLFNLLDNGSLPYFPGKLSRITDRLGNSLRLEYDSGGSRLLRVIDTLGRTNTIEYVPGGNRIQSVSDFSGRQVVYNYYRAGEVGGSNGDLKSARSPVVTGTPNTNDFPAGKTTTYAYASGFVDDRMNHNLASITDAKGQMWLRVQYGDTQDALDINFDRARSMQRGTNAPLLLTYERQQPAESNRWSVMKTIVNDPEGNVTIDWHDSLNRCVIHRDLAARAVPGVVVSGSNLPTEKPFPGDPDYWQTIYEWNADSLCTRVTFPRGNTTEFVYQRVFNGNAVRSGPFRRHDGDVRVLREVACCAAGDLNGDGISDTSELVWRFEFDPRFGAPAQECSAARGPRQSTSLDGTYYSAGTRSFHRGWDGTIKGSPRRIRQDSYSPWEFDGEEGVVSNPLYEQSGNSGTNPMYESKRWCFAVRVVDSRGNIDTGEYNDRGQPVLLTHIGRLLDGSDFPITSFEYHPNHQLAAIVHPKDTQGRRRRDEFIYHSDSGSGQLRTWIVDAAGPTPLAWNYQYDERANVTAVVDPRLNTNNYVFNQLDQCVARQTPGTSFGERVTTLYAYDENNNLTREDLENRDGEGALSSDNPLITTLYSYDELNRRQLLAHELTHTVQQRFATNRFFHDGADNLVQVDSPEAVNGNQPAAIVQQQFDVRRLLRMRTSAPGTADESVDRVDYNANGQVARVSQGGGGGGSGGAIRLLDYDGFGRCVSTTDGMGNVERFSYDASHNLIYKRLEGETNDVPGSAGNRLLAEERLTYDSLNRPLESRAALFDTVTGSALRSGFSSSKTAWVPNWSRRSVTDDNGSVTQFSYDSIGRLSGIIDAKLNITSYGYDANNNVTSITQADRADLGGATQTFISSFRYDALNRPVAAWDNVGNTNRYFYDSRGNVVRHVDPRGVAVVNEYDSFSRKLKIYVDKDGDGTIRPGELRMFDDNNRLTSLIDGNGHETRFTNDALGRCVGANYADGTSASLVWSPRSNLSRQTDANGTVTIYTYDELNRCTRKDIAPGPGVATATTFEQFSYDGASRLVLATNDGSMVEFSYDSLGRRARMKQDCIASAMEYDGVGNLVAMTYPSDRKVQYAYDPLNRVSNVLSSASAGMPPQAVASFAFEGRRLSRISRENGVNTRLTYDGEAKTANGAGDFGWQQVSQINHQIAGGGAIIDRSGFSYDRAQNKTSRKQLNAFAPGLELTTNDWSYDGISQLRLAIKTKGTSARIDDYVTDLNGNRLFTTNDGVVGVYTMDASLPEPADAQMNQYTGTPFGTQQYDHNGNLISIEKPVGSLIFAYDCADRLVSVSRNIGPAITPVVRYSYDALGRRISKTTYDDPKGGPVLTYFLLAPESDSIIERRYASGHYDSFICLLDDGLVLAQASDAGPMQYLLCDDLGSVVALTDDRGAVLERYSYDDFGAPHFLTGDGVEKVDSTGSPLTTSSYGNPHLFRGMVWEGESQLYCKKSSVVGPVRWMAPEARYVDPKTGRGLSRSSIQHCGESRYTAFGNNPWTSANQRSGIQHLHSEGVIHRDLAARNLLLSSSASPKISDFGISRVIGDDETEDCDDSDPFSALRQSVVTAREAGSGIATGRRIAPMHGGLETCGIGDLVARQVIRARPCGESRPRIDARKSISIIFQNDAGEEARRYNFFEAWPCRWKAPELSATKEIYRQDFGPVQPIKR